MASLLEIDHSTYVRYERPERFKKRHLPLPLTRRIAKILADHGVSYDDVLALAGIQDDEFEVPTLTLREQEVLNGFRHLHESQRAAVLVLINAMVDAKDAREPPATTLHAPQPTYRAAAAR